VAAAGLEVKGLVDLVRVLKGPAFKDVNQALRPMARGIADELRPHVEMAVRLSRAHQATAMAGTIRTKPDRVPVIVIGKTNPKFNQHKFGHKGESGQMRKLRRGSLAHGVIYGPLGGKRHTPTHENYYGIPRQSDGGPVMRTLHEGAVFRQGEIAYLNAYMEILRHYGLDAKAS